MRWRTDTADGRKQHSKGGFRTKREAQNFLTDTMAAIRGGTFSEPTKVKLGPFLLEEWLPARKLALRPSTWASYDTAIRRHVIPHIGGVQVQQLTPGRLDRLLNCWLALFPMQSARTSPTATSPRRPTHPS